MTRGISNDVHYQAVRDNGLDTKFKFFFFTVGVWMVPRHSIDMFSLLAFKGSSPHILPHLLDREAAGRLQTSSDTCS